MSKIFVTEALLHHITTLSVADRIIKTGYQKVGLKFSISIIGGKGTMHSVEIGCEGVQHEQTNRIPRDILTPYRHNNSDVVKIYYSDSMGIMLHFLDGDGNSIKSDYSRYIKEL